ncbi:glycosyltransferase [Candidatus Bathyarchaeota archaeon]|nr:MAG: glycosyltransferase [Candidatus Bathyarchaeota archaeon]
MRATMTAKANRELVLRELVSVIMPTFNGEKTVLDSIESVLNQTYKSIELIIIDDASRDNTFESITEHKRKNDIARYRAIKHDMNIGLAATLNHGIKECHGKYVIILHQDCVLADRNWIVNALEYFANSNVAVVTGYYGIPPEKLGFTAKAFGIFRRQYHAVSSVQVDEEVTFSEGKCDVYRKDVLESIGGFLERFRIAGEDLVVSYKIRQQGFLILKSYKLPVVQKFGPAADNLAKNLRKEFVFGKAMGGVFPMFKTFLFRKIGVSRYSRNRSLQRATQPLFVLTFTLLLLLSMVFLNILILWLSVIVLVIRYFFYVVTIWNELLLMADVFHKSRSFAFLESLLVAALGLIVDFVYTLGFSYGLVLYTIGARL